VKFFAKDFKQQQSYSVVTKESPYWMTSIAYVFLSEQAQTIKVWGVNTEFDNTQSKEVLGVTYPIKIEKTLKDMVMSMIEIVVLKNKIKAKI